MTGSHTHNLSFLDEVMLQHAQRNDLQPIWVKAAASRLDSKLQLRLARISAVKRCFDIAMVTLSAPIWLPLLCLIALAVRLDSRGSIFFMQKRTGLNGQIFRIYKFRTMYVSGEGDMRRQSQKHDNRHTRIGRFLRRISLDELPQLLNVLRGDMSLIGPRPHARYHDELFAHYAKGYGDRFRLRPGLTGLAQVQGQRGLLRTQEPLQARTDFDNAYIDQWSLGRDIAILFKTIAVVLKATNAH